MIPNLRLIDGYWWPATDKECRPAVMDQYLDADIAIKLCTAKNIVIQAGGNCGVWARYLSGHFKTVYTFEPDIINFLCLNLNVPNENVIRMQAALGDKARPVGMITTPENVGAHRVEGKGGAIPVLRIDDLRLPDLNFLQLDIEGYEYFALHGAIHTIDAYKPVIMIEDKGHHKKYGIERSSLTDLFDNLGYIPRKKINRDLIMVHKDNA